MRPGQVSAKLQQIAAIIEQSRSPRLSLVLEDLRLLLAFLEKQKKYFAFPTESKTSGPWENPIYIEDMLDKIKNDFSLASIYGEVVGIYEADDFYWVIAIEADDEEVIDELMELGIAHEISESDINFMDNIDPIFVWWDQFGQKLPGIEENYEDTCLVRYPIKQTSPARVENYGIS